MNDIRLGAKTIITLQNIRDHLSLVLWVHEHHQTLSDRQFSRVAEAMGRAESLCDVIDRHDTVTLTEWLRIRWFLLKCLPVTRLPEDNWPVAPKGRSSYTAP